MADQDNFDDRPQRNALPRMMMFVAAIVAIALAILAWYALGN